jgi:D-alanine-D-alanine ligase
MSRKMKIGFVYDILENVLSSQQDRPIRELTTELFTSKEANELITGLKDLSHEILIIDGAKEFAENVMRYRTLIDFVFNEAKGLFGPDRKMAVPTLCRIYGIPYLGSDAYAVTLSRNKWHTLAVASFAGAAVPASILIELDHLEMLDSWRHYPAIVKPNFESSSIGITDNSIVNDPMALCRQVSSIHERYQQPALVQEFLPGLEIQVSVLGNSPPVSLDVVGLTIQDGNGGLRDFVRGEDWLEGRVTFAPFRDNPIANKAANIALRLFRALGMQDYGRLDFRVTPSGNLFFIESATHPHILPTSSFAQAAQRRGMSFTAMLRELIAASLGRSKPRLY